MLINSVSATNPHAVRLARAYSHLDVLFSGLGSTRPPIDIDRLARMVGVSRVEITDLSSSDACLLPAASGHTVLLDSRSGRRRQRFSMAHELAHLLLHANGIRFRRARGDRSSVEEQLCDQVAADILMPKEMFRREMQ